MSLEEYIQVIATKRNPENEETAKQTIVLPLLKALNWDISDEKNTGEVKYEKEVGDGKKKGRVDIALMGPDKTKNRCVYLIEVKSPKHKLDDHVDQLVSYAVKEGVDLCVLTNAIEWWFYLPLEKAKIGEKRFAKLDIKSGVGQLARSFEQFLGRESVLNGEVQDRAKERLRALREVEHLDVQLPHVWKQMLQDPDKDLVELIRQRVLDKLEFRPTFQQVKSFLLGEGVRSSQDTKASKQLEPRLPTPSKPLSPKKPIKPKSFTLWGEHNVSTHKEILLRVCSLIFKRHPSAFDIIEQEWNTKNIFVTTDSAIPGAKRIPETRYYMQVLAGVIWIETKSRQLLALFGHEMDELYVPAWEEMRRRAG